MHLMYIKSKSNVAELRDTLIATLVYLYQVTNFHWTPSFVYTLNKNLIALTIRIRGVI